MTLTYENSSIFLIMGNAGFISLRHILWELEEDLFNPVPVEPLEISGVVPKAPALPRDVGTP